jgi:hypothetical protein
MTASAVLETAPEQVQVLPWSPELATYTALSLETA